MYKIIVMEILQKKFLYNYTIHINYKNGNFTEEILIQLYNNI